MTDDPSWDALRPLTTGTSTGRGPLPPVPPRAATYERLSRFEYDEAATELDQMVLAFGADLERAGHGNLADIVAEQAKTLRDTPRNTGRDLVGSLEAVANAAARLADLARTWRETHA